MTLLPETACLTPLSRSMEPAARPAAAMASADLAVVHPHSPPTPGLELEVVDTLEGLERLGPEWDSLFERTGKPHHVFQQHAFATLFARTYYPAAADGKAPTGRLAIVVGRRGGRLVLVWPLVAERCTGATVVSWLGEPVAQYGDVLVAPGEPALDLLRTAYQHILVALQPDVLRLRRVRADAETAPFLAELGLRPRLIQEAPCITLAAGGSAFEERQSGKAKKNRRRLMRRLDERGSVAFEEVQEAPARERTIAAGLADKREWIGRRGLFSPALSDWRFDAFLQSAATAPDNPTGCAVFALRLDDRQVAFALGFRCKRRLMLHLISHASDLERHGLGVLNLEAILRRTEAEGLEALDMLPPKAEYKLDWADGSIAVLDYSWGVNTRGRMWSALSDGLIRPAAKAFLNRLPLAMRKRLAKRQLLQQAFEGPSCA